MLDLIRYAVIYLLGNRARTGFVLPLLCLSTIIFSVYAFTVGYLKGELEAEASRRAIGFEQLRLLVGGRGFQQQVTSGDLARLSEFCKGVPHAQSRFLVEDLGVGYDQISSVNRRFRTVSGDSPLLQKLKYVTGHEIKPYENDDAKLGVVVHKDLPEVKHVFDSTQRYPTEIFIDFQDKKIRVPILGIMEDSFSDTREQDVKAVIHEDLATLSRNFRLSEHGERLYDNFKLRLNSRLKKDDSEVWEIIEKIDVAEKDKALTPPEGFEFRSPIWSFCTDDTLVIKCDHPDSDSFMSVGATRNALDKWLEHQKLLAEFELVLPPLEVREDMMYAEFYFDDLRGLVDASDKFSADDLGKTHDIAKVKSLKDLLNSVASKLQLLDQGLWIIASLLLLSLFFIQLQRTAHIRRQVGLLLANGARPSLILTAYLIQSVVILSISLITSLLLVNVTGKLLFWCLYNDAGAFQVSFEVILTLIVLLVSVLACTACMFYGLLCKPSLWPPRISFRSIHELIESS